MLQETESRLLPRLAPVWPEVIWNSDQNVPKITQHWALLGKNTIEYFIEYFFKYLRIYKKAKIIILTYVHN
jgi:hypothetical protein